MLLCHTSSVSSGRPCAVRADAAQRTGIGTERPPQLRQMERDALVAIQSFTEGAVQFFDRYGMLLVIARHVVQRYCRPPNRRWRRESHHP